MCRECFLVQFPAYVSPDVIFTEYAYFSSFSTSWLEHVRRYAEEMRRELQARSAQPRRRSGQQRWLSAAQLRRRGVPVLGIEPAQNVARAAEAAGVRTLPRFFGSDLAHQLKNEGRRADLIACNNTLAQIPDLNDFVAGLAGCLHRTVC